jgi:hypothetical protein
MNVTGASEGIVFDNTIFGGAPKFAKIDDGTVWFKHCVGQGHADSGTDISQAVGAVIHIWDSFAGYTLPAGINSQITSAGVFKGAFTGALTGNADTVTGFSPTAGKTLSVSKTMTLTAADDTGSYTLPTGTKTLLATDGSAASLTSFPTLNQNTTGSAATLTTPRTIGGVSFNGSANITVASATGGFTVTGGAMQSSGADFSFTDAGTPDTNAVRLFSTGGNIYIQAGSGRTINFRDQNGTLTMSLNTNTGLLSLGNINFGGANTMSFGANDSAGAGYRLVRVPNA